MARPNTSAQRRLEFVPILARTFADLGYRRATTAELAGRCGVRENILYRLWEDKRAMFIAALDYVYKCSEEIWSGLLQERDEGRSPAERILDFESSHHGEHGLYRIIFAGLSETDDPEISAALRQLFGRFQRFVQTQVQNHRGRKHAAWPDPELAAWAIVGLGTVSNIGRELGLFPARARQRLFQEIGSLLLGEQG